MRRAGRTLLLAAILLSAVAWRPGIHYPWRFARISDTHMNWSSNGAPLAGEPYGSVPLMYLADTLNTLGVDFLLLTGDISGSLLASNLRGEVDSLASFEARLNCPIYMCLGNWEASAVDTTSQRNPYYTFKHGYQRFMPAATGDVNWWKLDHKNLRFIFVQNNCEYGDTCPDPENEIPCYGVNNPSYGGVVPGWDWDGITVPGSAQRDSIAKWVSASDRKGRRLFILGHRPIYGSNRSAQNIRPNLNQGTDEGVNGIGFVHEIEDSLGAAERAAYLGGDQHIAMWDNYAIADSGKAASGVKGIYHMMCDWGSSRTSDSLETTCATATLQAAKWYDGNGSVRLYRNEAGVGIGCADYVPEGEKDYVEETDDPGVEHLFTWELYTVYGDDVLVEVFRIYTTQSAEWEFYTGAGSHAVLNRSRLTLDAR